MDSDQSDLIEGIKTFFVVPELTALPEDCLQSFFQKGFETYFLNDDPYVPLKDKVDVLFSLFPELILFFNIDRRLAGVEWPEFIARIKEKHGDRAMAGVLYRKQNDPEVARKLERLYLFDIGIPCGCIPMEYQKAKNLSLLTSVLTANQANGRRKFIRAICANRCRFNLYHDGVRYEGEIRDISISHFSGVFDGREPVMETAARIDDIQLFLSGALCKVNALLCVKRRVGPSTIYVFIFKDGRGHDGLDPEMLGKVNSFIYNTYQERIGSFVKRAFEAARLKISRNPAPRGPSSIGAPGSIGASGPGGAPAS
jgi:hypothetical protein